jgi:hypothetical protein
LRRIVVIGDVDMCTSPAIADGDGEDLRTETVDTSVGSLSGGAVDTGLLKHGGQATHEFVGGGVLSDALRGAAAGVQDGGVVAAPERPSDCGKRRVRQLT